MMALFKFFTSFYNICNFTYTCYIHFISSHSCSSLCFIFCTPLPVVVVVAAIAAVGLIRCVDLGERE